MASTAITHVILFIAVLGIASGLLVAIKNYSDKTEGTFKEKSDDYNKIIKTNIKIEVIHYNNVSNVTSIYVRNTGKTNMYTKDMDVYIDGLRAPRNDTNRTIEILTDTEVTNPGVWDPKEQILIKVNRTLNKDIGHEVIVTTPYTVRDSDSFSI